MLPFVMPGTDVPLELEGDVLLAPDGGTVPIVRGIPRFTESGYAEAFGFQWNEHPLTQLDSETGSPISRERLERCLGQPVGSLAGARVLEAGCGAGRFTELLVESGALVHAVDLSTAVDANRGNIGERENYRIAQADIRQLPFAPESFGVVLCIGVLQHTPSPEASIRALWQMVAPGGRLVIDHYRWTLGRIVKLEWLYRQVLKRLRPERAKRITDRAVGAVFPIHWALRERPAAHRLLGLVSPCVSYVASMPELTREQHLELSTLDTFDNLTDRYKHLRTPAAVERTLAGLGAIGIEVWKGGNGVEARATKPG